MSIHFDWSLSKPLEQMKSKYDVVVIGSGYGGGVAASRLSRAGLSVCVLERGREIKSGEFKPGAVSNLNATQINGRKIQLGDPANLYDFRTGDDLHVLLGCGLGGGSLINSALALRPELETLKNRGWPSALFKGEELEQSFLRAERMLGANPYPDPESIQKFKAFDNGAKLLGLRAKVKNNAIHFQDGVNRANVKQSACTLCGDCWSGCNVGAKNTVALTYLTDALNHGADIFTTLQVQHLEKVERSRDDSPWRVRFNLNKKRKIRDKLKGLSTRFRGEKTEPSLKSVTADIVIVAAGSLGSTEILLRSKEHGLGFSDRLGKGFSANGDDIVLGVNQDQQVNGNASQKRAMKNVHSEGGSRVGPNCMGYVRYKDEGLEGGALLIEDGAMIPAMSALAPLKALTSGKPKRAFKMLMDGPFKGLRAHTQTHYLVSHDSSEGEMVLKNDRLEIHWPEIHNQVLYQKYEAVMKKMIEGLGGEYKESPLSEMSGRKVTAHPLGGCGMGNDAETGVVNHKCQVFQAGVQGREDPEVHSGLYVCDGAVMPTSLGANPMLTIAAMAERAMILLAQDRGLSFDDKRKEGVPLRSATI
jgi:cholesterol oxidase